MKDCDKIFAQKLLNEQYFTYFCSIIRTYHGLAD